MAKVRTNFLRTVIDVQNIVIEHKKRGATQRWIYENIINAPGSSYHMSYETFRRYMGINAKAEILKKT